MKQTSLSDFHSKITNHIILDD